MKSSFLDILFNNKLYRIYFFIFLSILIFSFSYNNGIFWDNVLFTSKIGNHLYETNVFNWYLPDSIDNAHPPTLGFLVAILWKLFGHHLWVSHLVLIPFTIGLFYQLFKFTAFYTKPKYLTIYAFILIIADPTLFTQLVIVSPEVIQLFFFFLAINSILYQNYYLKIIGLFFLSIISYRGMMLCAGIFIFEVLNNYIIDKKKIKSLLNSKFIISYVIGSIPALLYLTWRLIVKGWIFTHPNSPWVEFSKFASFKEFFRNIIVLIHRYNDFGRVFIFVLIIYSILRFYKTIFTEQIKQLLLLAMTSVFVIIIASLIMTNAFGHRYFIASYIVLALLSFIILIKFYKRKKIIYTLLLVGLISGNLWIYPRNISQGWDATLAHLPYYDLRTEAINYLNKNNIEIEDVGTFFPNLTSLDNVDLSGDMRSFTHFNGQNDYLFYSNVYNLTDEEYEIIDTKYTLVKQFNKYNIHVNIYKLK